MKTILLFLILTFFVSCKNNSETKMYENDMNAPTKELTMKGTWKQISFYNYTDNMISDTILASESSKQIKMYSDTKVMWSRFRDSDSLDWFGYGDYIIGDSTLTEVIDYGSKAMNEAIKKEKKFTFKLILDKDKFSQIQVDEDGNLNLRGSADDFVGEKQLGVSLGDNFDTSINYTAFKDKIQGTRDPASQGGNDSVVFRIKKEVLEKYKNRSESMGETFVEGDMKIAKGDFEVIRFGKENTGNQSSFNSKLEVKEPFAETKIDVLKARKDGIPKEEFGLNKNKAKLETQQEKVEATIETIKTNLIPQPIIKKYIETNN